MTPMPNQSSKFNKPKIKPNSDHNHPLVTSARILLPQELSGVILSTLPPEIRLICSLGVSLLTTFAQDWLKSVLVPPTITRIILGDFYSQLWKQILDTDPPPLSESKLDSTEHLKRQLVKQKQRQSYEESSTNSRRQHDPMNNQQFRTESQNQSDIVLSKNSTNSNDETRHVQIPNTTRSTQKRAISESLIQNNKKPRIPVLKNLRCLDDSPI